MTQCLVEVLKCFLLHFEFSVTFTEFIQCMNSVSSFGITRHDCECLFQVRDRTFSFSQTSKSHRNLQGVHGLGKFLMQPLMDSQCTLQIVKCLVIFAHSAIHGTYAAERYCFAAQVIDGFVKRFSLEMTFKRFVIPPHVPIDPSGAVERNRFACGAQMRVS